MEEERSASDKVGENVETPVVETPVEPTPEVVETPTEE